MGKRTNPGKRQWGNTHNAHLSRRCFGKQLVNAQHRNSLSVTRSGKEKAHLHHMWPAAPQTLGTRNESFGGEHGQWQTHPLDLRHLLSLLSDSTSFSLFSQPPLWRCITWQWGRTSQSRAFCFYCSQMGIQFLKKGGKKTREGTLLLLADAKGEPFFAKYEISVCLLEFQILSVFTESTFTQTGTKATLLWTSVLRSHLALLPIPPAAAIKTPNLFSK